MNREIRREATNLEALEFTDAMIWLPLLMQAVVRGGQTVIRGRTFRNCLLSGPAVMLALKGVDLDGCNLGWGGGDMRGLILRPLSPTTVVGTLPFEDCRFVECDFNGVGFTGPEAFIEALLAVPTRDVS